MFFSLGRVFPELAQLPHLSFLARATLLTLVPSVILNVILVRTALAPVRELTEVAERVQGGEMDARVGSSIHADRELTRLSDTFNRMLDTLSLMARKQRELTAVVLEAEEAERRRVSEELFSQPAQVLSSVLLELSLLERQLEQGPGKERATSLRSGILAALNEIRAVARGLNPPELEELGLGPALQALVRTASERSGVPVELRVALDNPDLVSRERGVATYRIAQEALANALRHADARTIRVHLSSREGLLQLQVEDDGQGFDVPEALEGAARSVGLLWMMERASVVGGTLTITSLPGQGTLLRLQAPVEEPQALLA